MKRENMQKLLLFPILFVCLYLLIVVNLVSMKLIDILSAFFMARAKALNCPKNEQFVLFYLAKATS